MFVHLHLHTEYSLVDSVVRIQSESEGVPGLMDAVVAAGIPSVLGYRWPVSSSGALILAQTFYDKLHQHESLETALLLARQEVRTQLGDEDQTWLSPILVVQE